MVPTEALGLFVGAVVLGAIHGVEPGHGWPVAATYALDQGNKWLYGFAASLIIGVGHLISSIAMVLVFFYAKSYFNLTQVNEPIHLAWNVYIGGPVSVGAGLLLIALGIREYRHGHCHGGNEAAHAPKHDHAYAGPHAHDHRDHPRGFLPRLKGYLPFERAGQSRSRDQSDEAANRGLLGIAWFAFLIGFAHEEEFEIIGLCAGSVFCLELMLAYAVTVIVAIVGLTMLLIAGYEHSEEKVEQYTPFLPVFSAAVLILLGIGFISGLL